MTVLRTDVRRTLPQASSTVERATTIARQGSVRRASVFPFTIAFRTVFAHGRSSWDEDYVYWTNQAGALSIMRAPRLGGAPEEVISTGEIPGGLAIDLGIRLLVECRGNWGQFESSPKRVSEENWR